MVYVSERAFGSMGGTGRRGGNIQIEGPPEVLENKVYMGNMDIRMTEYHVMKLLQPCGTVIRLKFIWHNSGPHKGEPAGFCFAEFSNREGALKAIRTLDGKSALGRQLAVRFAEPRDQERVSAKGAAPSREPRRTTENKRQIRTNLASTAPAPWRTKPVNNPIENQINAIRTKLTAMEGGGDSSLFPVLPLSATLSTPPPSTPGPAASDGRPEALPQRRKRNIFGNVGTASSLLAPRLARKRNGLPAGLRTKRPAEGQPAEAPKRGRSGDSDVESASLATTTTTTTADPEPPSLAQLLDPPESPPAENDALQALLGFGASDDET